MAKVKVSEASGVVLDYMVALALDHNIVWDGITYWISDLNASKLIGSKWKTGGRPCGWSPSNYWEHGGPIIERERIDIIAPRPKWPKWKTYIPTWPLPSGAMLSEYTQHGPTPLIAAMRCYVTSKLGPEVEVPDELLEE